MANRNDGKQYTFRINFNNPDHLKVYRKEIREGYCRDRYYTC